MQRWRQSHRWLDYVSVIHQILLLLISLFYVKSWFIYGAWWVCRHEKKKKSFENQTEVKVWRLSHRFIEIHIIMSLLSWLLLLGFCSYFMFFYLPHRAIAVSAQTAPPPRMVNLCQATQTTIIAPNPMLQGAILMQQMQGNRCHCSQLFILLYLF